MPTRYGLVGAGMRARMYTDAIAGPYADIATLAAVADTNSGRMEYHVDRQVDQGSPAPSTWAPDDLETMIRAERLDRIIVTTPDFTHAGYVVRALDAGVDVVVEKPLTIDEERAAAIVAASERSGRTVVVTFNYRYSPRNMALREAIAQGDIGDVTSVHFQWLLDTQHGADYFRRWHRYKANSGGLLVHKASHHFDLVNWWIQDSPSRVFASGGLRFYGAANAAGRGLGPRPARGTSEAGETDPFSLDLRSDPTLEALYLKNESLDGYLRDRDVFDDGITIEDNLSLVVDYDQGASMAYSLNAHSPWEGYQVAVNGTEGRLELDVVERGGVDRHGDIDPSIRSAERPDSLVRPVGDRLVLQRHWEQARELPIADDDGDHGGADPRLLRDVFVGTDGDPLRRRSGVIDGLRAIAVGIAGNRSLATGQPVRIADLALGRPLGRDEQVGA